MACITCSSQNLEVSEELGEKNVNENDIQLEFLINLACSELQRNNIIVHLCNICKTNFENIHIELDNENKFDQRKIIIKFPVSSRIDIFALFHNCSALQIQDSSTGSASVIYWLRYITSRDFWSEENFLASTNSSFNLLEFSVGSFKSKELFICHFSLPVNANQLLASSLQFNFDESHLSIYVYDPHAATNYIIDSSFNDFEKYIVYQQLASSSVVIYLFIRNHFKCWSEIDVRERVIHLPWINGDYSKCSVIKLIIEETPQDINFSFINFFNKLASCGFEIWHANNLQNDEPNNDLLKQICEYYEDKSCSYSLKVLFSRGYKVLDKIDDLLFNKIKEEVCHKPNFDAVIYYVVRNIVDRHEFFDITTAFEKCEKLLTENEIDNLYPLENYILAKSCIVMPTNVLYLQPMLSRSNRVLRYFGNEKFIRVLVRDSDKSKFIGTSVNENIANEIKSIINKGLHTDDEIFSFLGCSNSQLRSHGCWFFSGNCSEVRKWIGNLSNERCIPRYMTRMGLFFTLP